MRAILFASATVASRTGRRSRSPRVHAPAALFHRAARYTIDVAPSTSNRRISRLPALVIRPRRVLPPVECCLGTSPSQAAKCRALLKATMPSPTVAATGDAVIGPMPGIVARRRAVSSCRACATIPASRVATLSAERRQVLELVHALRCGQAELGRQAAQGVRQHGLLLGQQRSGRMQGEDVLLLQAL